jgi:mannose-6-phosphate isomerase-like protein (cupin superfamily)
MEPVLMELTSGQRSRTLEPFQGEEFGFIIQGIVTICFGTKSYQVRAGECFYFEATREHCIENSGKRLAKLLWITTPPMF